VLARDDIGKRGGFFDFLFLLQDLGCSSAKTLPPDYFKPLDTLELVYQLQATAYSPALTRTPRSHDLPRMVTVQRLGEFIVYSYGTPKDSPSKSS